MSSESGTIASERLPENADHDRGECWLLSNSCLDAIEESERILV
jgi:hypothetical protein